MNSDAPGRCERAIFVGPGGVSEDGRVSRCAPAPAAGVIAHAGNGAEDTVTVREGELGATEGDFGQWTGRKICCRADILPVCVSHDELSAECPQPFNRSTNLCRLRGGNRSADTGSWLDASARGSAATIKSSLTAMGWVIVV